MEQHLSVIFGMSIIPSRAQEVFIKGAVENTPIHVFKVLSELLEKRGYKLFVIKEHGQDFDVVYPTPENK